MDHSQISQIVDLVQSQLGDQYRVILHDVQKLNETRSGILIHPIGSLQIATPVFYPEVFGDTVESAANHIVDTFHSLADADQNLNTIESLINNRESFLNHATLAVCNTNWNSAMLDDIPHRNIPGTDLCSYTRISLPGDASIRPAYDLLNKLHITGDELLAAAYENTRSAGFYITSLSDIFRNFNPPVDIPEDVPEDFMLYALTTASKIHGASVIAYPEALQEAAEKVGSNSLYILPCSIHECLAISTDGQNARDLENMVARINEETVDVSERLSDHVYLYDGSQLLMAKDLAPDIENTMTSHKRRGR